jgi:hypothetical protein
MIDARLEEPDVLVWVGPLVVCDGDPPDPEVEVELPQAETASATVNPSVMNSVRPGRTRRRAVASTEREALPIARFLSSI